MTRLGIRQGTTIGILILLLLFALTDCKKKATSSPDNPPNIISKEPSGYTLIHKIGDTINFSITATDADEDPIDYKTLKNGTKVNDSYTFEFITDEIGSFLIQIIAYNAEADTAEWQVNVENQTPVIDYTFGFPINDNEDEIMIGDTVKTIIIYDNEDTIDDIIIELSQSNPDLIKLRLEDNKLIIEDYLADGNGTAEITLKVTDTHGSVTEKSFVYTINPMTDISGTILDSDTWEANTDLHGWIIIDGDTTWTDDQCKYSIQIDPTSSIDVEAGYRSLDKTQPMSFITTARILANNDVSGMDIMVVTYLNNNMTPEEFKILAFETNFSGVAMNYHGAKVPSTDMVDYIILSGNTAVDYKGDNYIEAFPDSELVIVKSLIRDSIDVHLKYPFLMVDTTYYDGIYQDFDVCSWKHARYDNLSIGSKDINSDGFVDNISITITGDWSEDWYHKWWLSGILEEGFSARGLFGPATDPILEGKTLVYEHIGTEWVHDADIKFIKFIEGVAHEIGYLKPKMPLDDVFKIQY